MQHRGVEIVDMKGVIDGTKAEGISFAECHAASDAATGHEHGTALGVVVTTVASLAHGSATELAAPDHECVFEHTAAFQIGDESGSALIDFPGLLFDSQPSHRIFFRK